nr:proline-rich receptor-like protein kinase PERK10 [Aegilops tauschii subsp. strangulata]
MALRRPLSRPRRQPAVGRHSVAAPPPRDPQRQRTSPPATSSPRPVSPPFSSMRCPTGAPSPEHQWRGPPESSSHRASEPADDLDLQATPSHPCLLDLLTPSRRSRTGDELPAAAPDPTLVSSPGRPPRLHLPRRRAAR